MFFSGNISSSIFVFITYHRLKVVIITNLEQKQKSA